MLKGLNCMQGFALLFLVLIAYLLVFSYCGFDEANNFISAWGTLLAVWVMYSTLSEMKKQFMGGDKPVIVVDDIKLCGSDILVDSKSGLTRPNKFVVRMTFSNWGDASAFNVLVKVVYINSQEKENINVLNWEIQGFSVVGKGREKSIHKTLELDVAQQICDEVRYRNEHNPILRVETYYRNVHEQWFRNIQLIELKEVWRKLDDGNNHFGGERKKLSDVQDFSFYVIEHNGKNTGCKEISYRDVELACGFKNGIITDGKEELQ